MSPDAALVVKQRGASPPIGILNARVAPANPASRIFRS